MNAPSPTETISWSNSLPLLVLAGGAVYLAARILKSAGKTASDVAEGLQLKKSQAQVASEARAQEAIKQYLDQAVKVQKPSRPEGFWAQLAERIYRDTRYASSGDNHRDAQLCMSYVSNDADYALLYKNYGWRQETWFGLIPDGGPKDLNMAISSNLSKQQKTSLNTLYSQRGVSMRFI